MCEVISQPSETRCSEFSSVNWVVSDWVTWSDGLFDFEENICKFSHDIITPIIGICEKNYFSLWDICLVNVTFTWLEILDSLYLSGIASEVYRYCNLISAEEIQGSLLQPVIYQVHVQKEFGLHWHPMCWIVLFTCFESLTSYAMTCFFPSNSWYQTAPRSAPESSVCNIDSFVKSR